MFAILYCGIMFKTRYLMNVTTVLACSSFSYSILSMLNFVTKGKPDKEKHYQIYEISRDKVDLVYLALCTLKGVTIIYNQHFFPNFDCTKKRINLS